MITFPYGVRSRSSRALSTATILIVASTIALNPLKSSAYVPPLDAGRRNVQQSPHALIVRRAVDMNSGALRCSYGTWKPTRHLSTSLRQHPPCILSSSGSRSMRFTTTMAQDGHHLHTTTTMFHGRPSTTKLYTSSATDANPSLALAGPSRQDLQAMLSALAFVAIDVAFRRLFRALSITFPSSLGACTVLFTLLLLLPKSIANDVLYQPLQPGAALLAKWLPVFFVPSLISLPLANSIGSSIEVIKIGTVIVIGFFVSLLSTAFSVTTLRQWKQSTTAPSSGPSSQAIDTINGKVDTTTTTTSSSSSTAAISVPPKKAYTDELFNFFCLTTAVTGVRAISAATKGTAGSSAWTALFLLSSTLNSFVFGARLPTKFKQLIHPLVTCTSLCWTLMSVFAFATNQTFRNVLKQYTVGRGLRWGSVGSGDILLFLLGPAVVSLAISMYERRQLMRENLAEVATAIAVSTMGGLFGTALAVRILNIASPFLRLSLLSRNITSPLAMAIASILGADISLAVSMVVVTGLIGANFGAAILDAVGIRDAVARGLGIGAAAHGLGTAAFSNEKDAFPFAAIAMALTATTATVTVSIPVIRKCLVRLALGL